MTGFLTRAELQETIPETTKALTWLVPALESAVKSQGKRSLFGSDKGIAAYRKAIDHLESLVTAMFVEQLITTDMKYEDLHAMLVMVMTNFAAVYPNWPIAYQFADKFIVPGTHQDVVDAIERARRGRLAWEGPCYTR